MLIFSLFFGIMSYMNSDPIKSSFFLVFTMLFCMPMMSFVSYVWYSYFVCMLFLSGIFVILVYFSSMSSFLELKIYFWFVGLVMTLLCFCMFEDFFFCNLSGLTVFYYDLNFFLLFYLVIILLFFMSFVSYYLSFSGALRSI
uniref:NADH dehydrogenase subunit 6 n=2 Tax=Angiostrongylus TaxID=6312 RepID=A0A0M4JK55_ANGCA|nr:NADH dehydrogenase subunit 6 [Angiostrongylus malaysiensis]ALD62326.1 NADH dehydrogenase subunit 6 [Angiostrongylus cantonensis]ANG44576.1 NADH dehydrogenase subunit 6 [Angiostrongylus malaysiensis]